MQEPIRDEPFFVRFLEGEDFPELQSDVRAGRVPIVTMKYPSDDDEWPTS